MTPFDVVRRIWATLLLAIHWSLVLTYMFTHVRRRKHIAVLQVRLKAMSLPVPSDALSKSPDLSGENSNRPP